MLDIVKSLPPVWCLLPPINWFLWVTYQDAILWIFLMKEIKTSNWRWNSLTLFWNVCIGLVMEIHGLYNFISQMMVWSSDVTFTQQSLLWYVKTYFKVWPVLSHLIYTVSLYGGIMWHSNIKWILLLFPGGRSVPRPQYWKRHQHCGCSTHTTGAGWGKIVLVYVKVLCLIYKTRE